MERLGVIVGMQAEAYLARHLKPVAIEISGATPEGTEQALDRLFKKEVDAIISFGFAGGLDPLIKVGSILIPHSVRIHQQDYSVDSTLRLRLGAENSSVKIGALLHTDSIITSSKEKNKLFQETGCVATDMESGRVAYFCNTHKIPFAVLRVVCDSAKRDLPPAACLALSPEGHVKIVEVISSVFSKPLQLSNLICLGIEAGLARWQLDRFLEKSVNL